MAVGFFGLKKSHLGFKGSDIGYFLELCVMWSVFKTDQGRRRPCWVGRWSGSQGNGDAVFDVVMAGKKEREQGTKPSSVAHAKFGRTGEQPQAGERTTTMFTVLKLHPEISLQKFKKVRAWLDPDTFLYAGKKKKNKHCSHVLIITTVF